MFSIASVVKVIALVVPQIAVLSSSWRCLVKASLGLGPTVGAGGPAAILIGIGLDFETTPVGVDHDATCWFEAFDLTATGGR